MHESSSTFGQKMMELHYCTALNGPLRLSHRVGLFFIFVLAEWIKERFDVFVSLFIDARPSTVQRIIDSTTAFLKGLSLLNFIIFLLHGSYPSVKERLLGLTMAPSKPQVMRQLSYGYMNREILWHGFSEFIFHVLPHFNLFALHNWFRRRLWLGQDWGSAEPLNVNFEQCAFCGLAPSLPHLTDCGHIYCYYCLRANCLADANFPCSVCSKPVYRWSPPHQHS